MQKFVTQLLPYILFLGTLWITGLSINKEEGDLIRLSFEASVDYYTANPGSWNYKALHLKKDSSATIALFGDSFLGSDNYRPFWHPLSEEYSIASFRTHDFMEANPIRLSLCAKDSVRRLFSKDPDFIVIETIEREFYSNLSSYTAPSCSLMKKVKHSTVKTSSFLQVASEGLAHIARTFGLSIKPSQKKVLTFPTEKAPLRLTDKLLVYHRDLSQRKRTTSFALIDEMNQAIKDVSHSYPESHVLLIIIPDKLTTYEKFISPNLDFPPSFLHQIDTFPNYCIDVSSFINSLIDRGEVDVYKYSGTHFSEGGADQIGEFIKGQLDSLISIQEYLTTDSPGFAQDKFEYSITQPID